MRPERGIRPDAPEADDPYLAESVEETIARFKKELSEGEMVELLEDVDHFDLTAGQPLIVVNEASGLTLAARVLNSRTGTDDPQLLVLVLQVLI